MYADEKIVLQYNILNLNVFIIVQNEFNKLKVCAGKYALKNKYIKN